MFQFAVGDVGLDIAAKPVKGAPYSAEATTETVQTLSDGNRIQQKQSSMVYRDSEGRTRREHTVGPMIPLAGGDEPPQLIFINDLLYFCTVLGLTNDVLFFFKELFYDGLLEHI